MAGTLLLLAAHALPTGYLLESPEMPLPPTTTLPLWSPPGRGARPFSDLALPTSTKPTKLGARPFAPPHAGGKDLVLGLKQGPAVC